MPDINEQLKAFGLRVAVMPLDQLKAYPRNSKKHGQKDLAAIFTSINKFGFKDVVLVDPDFEIIAGHGRVLAAREKGLTELPVMICDMDKNEAKAYRIAHNRSANIAKYDDSIITEELSFLKEAGWKLEEFAPLQLDKWTDKLDIPKFDLDIIEPKEKEELTAADVPDCLFESDNEWDVPTLKLKMQADAVDLPFVQWGDVARRDVHRGTWHFYTDDNKFDVLWNDPTGPLQSKANTCVEPNFSTGPQFPRGQAMGLIHRKRWIARFWQEHGIRIIVDINIDPRLYDLILLGVPKGWRAWATRGMPKYIDYLYSSNEIACKHAGTDDILFVVYAGGKGIQEICQKEGWIWIPDRKTYDRKAWTEKMNQEMKDEVRICANPKAVTPNQPKNGARNPKND